MSWWAYTYLFVLISIYVIGGIGEYKGWFESSIDFIETLFVCIFVVAFFYPSVTEFLGYTFFLMLGLGIFYHLERAQRDAKEYLVESTSIHKNAILVVGVIFGIPFIMFGYVLGIMAALENV
jgi:hypothetical protein